MVYFTCLVRSDALRLAKKAGLPTKYKCEAKILKAADRDKLDAKPCPDCEAVSTKPDHIR